MHHCRQLLENDVCDMTIVQSQNKQFGGGRNSGLALITYMSFGKRFNLEIFHISDGVARLFIGLTVTNGYQGAKTVLFK